MSLERKGITRKQPAALRSSAMAKVPREQLNRAGRPTAAELDRRKARVMVVATELFVTHGYAATSLVDIARSAGVATRTLYQHFGDKEALFREVIFARDAGAALSRPTVQSGDSLFDVLCRASRYAYDASFEDRSVGLMRLMIAESTRFPDFMQQIGSSVFARFRRTFELVFRQLATAGLIPAGDHARSAELFVDLVLGSQPIMTYTSWGSGPPTTEDLDERVDLFILGRFGATVASTSRSRTVATAA